LLVDPPAHPAASTDSGMDIVFPSDYGNTKVSGAMLPFQHDTAWRG
jgi:hypothetical protein